MPFFKSCLLKTNEGPESEENKFIWSISNENPQFVDISEYNYELDYYLLQLTLAMLRLPIYSRLADEGSDLGAIE